MKIKAKLIIISAVLLLVTVIAYSVFLSVFLESTAGKMNDSYLSGIASSQAKSVSLYVKEAADRFDAISALPAIQDFTKGSFKESSAEFKAAKAQLDALTSDKGVYTAVIYDSSNTALIASGEGSDQVTNADGLCNTSAAEKTPVIFSPEGTKKTYGVSVSGKINNYNLGLVFSKEGLSKIIMMSNSSVFIVDPNGSIAAPSLEYAVKYGETGLTQTMKDAQQFVDSATSSPQKFIADSGANIAFAVSADNGWKVVSYLSKDNVTNYSSKASSGVTGIAVTMLIVCLAAGIVLIILVTNPFYKIQDTLLKISRGDHDARVEIMSRNEYGDIARVFNDIVDNILVSESRYRTIIEMSDNIIFEWNLESKEVTFSNNFNKKFSYRAPSDHFADSFLVKCKLHPDDDQRYKSDLQRLEKGENFKHNEYRIKNVYGDYIWVLIRTASILDQNDQPVKIVGVIVDIDRSKKNEDVLTARASFDSLTGVYNRESIETVITNELELIAARKVEFAILFIDIDDFKFYNDQYSHATGDQVLRFTATTIKNAVIDKGHVGRYGGDEFIVCVKEADSNDPAAIAEKILNTLKEGFESDSGDRLTVNVSIGISIIKDNSRRVEEIIGQADDAMYRIKKSGKSNFGFLET